MKISIWRKYCRKSLANCFSLMLAFFTLLLPACSQTTVHIMSTRFDGNKLSLITRWPAATDFDIRILDIDKSKFIERYKIQGIEINADTKVFHEGNKTMLTECKSADRYKLPKISTLYELNNDGTTTVLGKFYGDIVGQDDDYFYTIEHTKFIDESGKYAGILELIPYRYDKHLKKKIDGHFSERMDLVIMSINKDVNQYWFTCRHRPVKLGNYRAKVAIVCKSQGNGLTNYYEYDKDVFSEFTFVDKNSFWIFDSIRIIRFSKEKTEFDEVFRPDYIIPIPSQITAPGDNFFWVYNSREFDSLYKFNDAAFEKLKNKLINQRVLTRDIDLRNINGIKYDTPFHYDGEHIWIFAGNGSNKINIHSIIRVNKANGMVYAEYPFKPYAYEAIMTPLYGIRDFAALLLMWIFK